MHGSCLQVWPILVVMFFENGHQLIARQHAVPKLFFLFNSQCCPMDTLWSGCHYHIMNVYKNILKSITIDNKYVNIRIYYLWFYYANWISQSPPVNMQKSSYILGLQNNQALPPYAKGGRLMITKAPCHY